MKAALILILALWPTGAGTATIKGNGYDAAMREIKTIFPNQWPIVYAVVTHEKGAIGYQGGNNGDTQFGRRYPFHYRNIMETARSISRYTTEYALHPAGEYFDFLAAHYHNGTEASNKALARSVRSIYKRLKRG